MRVALFGAPGAGKSTVAAEAMAELREQGYPAELVSEFAREFIVANGGIKNAYEQVFIAREQRRREETLAEKESLIVFTDSPFLVNHVYAGLLLGDRHKSKGDHLMLEVLYKEFLQALRDYDVIAFVTRPSEGSHADGVRLHDESESDTIERLMKAFIDMHGGPDITLSGTREERKQALVKYIKSASGDISEVRILDK
jgi:nicotinamide riboside kinase